MEKSTDSRNLSDLKIGLNNLTAGANPFMQFHHTTDETRDKIRGSVKQLGSDHEIDNYLGLQDPQMKIRGNHNQSMHGGSQKLSDDGTPNHNEYDSGNRTGDNKSKRRNRSIGFQQQNHSLQKRNKHYTSEFDTMAKQNGIFVIE